MTEAEWLSSTDPRPMLEFLRNSDSASKRKLRLFAVACCRRIEPHLDEHGRNAVDVAELFADGLASDGELASAERSTYMDWNQEPYLTMGFTPADDALDAAWSAAKDDSFRASRDTSEHARNTIHWSSEQVEYDREVAIQCKQLRDIVGNPFRATPAIAPAWLAPEVITLARAIYDVRAFERLPLLVDTLEAAGSTGADILAHCRSQTDHVRGCWVVDLLLGKE
jgi:hypothetical protein